MSNKKVTIQPYIFSVLYGNHINSVWLKIMTGHILKTAKRVFGIPDFKYYTLGDGLSAIFKRSPGKIIAGSGIPPPTQLELKFN